MPEIKDAYFLSLLNQKSFNLCAGKGGGGNWTQIKSDVMLDSDSPVAGHITCYISSRTCYIALLGYLCNMLYNIVIISYATFIYNISI